MTNLNYETLLTLNEILKDLDATQLPRIEMSQLVSEYLKAASEEITDRLERNQLGYNRVNLFPWGTEEKYVDIDQIECILNNIRGK